MGQLKRGYSFLHGVLTFPSKIEALDVDEQGFLLVLTQAGVVRVASEDTPSPQTIKDWKGFYQ